MSLELRKAERRKAKLRIGLFGPPGSGKTYSALKIAHGMTDWEKICVIDTENKSADLYSHLGPYNVITIVPPYEPEKYVDAIRMAERAGMQVIIIDSITHEWSGTGGMLEIADSMLASMRDGRLIWTKITPRHNRFIDALLQSPAHTIACGRSKVDTAMVESERNGRKVQIPEKIGLKAITREGFEYEMTVAFDIAINHYATCSKDRTKSEDGLAIFQDRPAQKLSEEHGAKLKAWSEEGKADIVALKRDVLGELDRLELFLPSEAADKAPFIREAIQKVTGFDPGVDENYESIVAALKQASPADAQAKMYGPKPPAEPPAAPPEPPPAPPSPPTPPVPPVTPSTPPETPPAPPAGEVLQAGETLQAEVGYATNPDGSHELLEVSFSQSAVDKVFGDKLPSPEKPVTIDAWIRDAKKCKTPGEAQALLNYMTETKERDVHVQMVRGILTSTGMIKADPKV